MEILVFRTSINFPAGLVLFFLLVIAKITTAAEKEKQFNSHKTSGMSHIPWNMLLDPNYTSHKKVATKNYTFPPSSHHNKPLSDTSTLHPHHSYHAFKETLSPVGHYVTPLPTQFSPSYNPHKKNMLHPSETRPQQIDYGSQFMAPLPNRPSEKIIFPSVQSYQTRRPDIHQRQTSPPLQKSKITGQSTRKDERRKQTIRKPEDYFDTDDSDYMDNFYQDYDYSPDNTRPVYKPPKRQSQYYYPKMKDTKDPLGLLPSASDPDGFFSKAKDLLKGGSYGKLNYAPSSPDYYSHYSPQKQHYGDPDTSYYSEDGYGSPGYPNKAEYYAPSGYDYEGPIDEKYGGVYPYPDKRKGSKYGPLAFALGLLPLGLLLASLVPTVVTIPVTTAVATGRRRKRSLRFINPTLDIISTYNMTALEDPQCMNRIFCEVVRNGKQETSSIVQKFYYKIASLLNEKIAELLGVKKLIFAVRKDKCQEFRCDVDRKSYDMPSKNGTSALKS